VATRSVRGMASGSSWLFISVWGAERGMDIERCEIGKSKRE
jgi:hypothetical protein